MASKRIKMRGASVAIARNGSLCVSGFEAGTLSGPIHTVWITTDALHPEDVLDFVGVVQEWITITTKRAVEELDRQNSPTFDIF